MSKFITSLFTAGALALAAVAATATPSAAAEAAAPQMSQNVSKALAALFGAAAKKDWETAEKMLSVARSADGGVTEFDEFEIAVAAAYVGMNRHSNSKALANYKKVIASPYFATAQTVPVQIGTLKNAMMLSNAESEFTDSIAYGQKLVAMGAVDDTTAIALATAYFGTKDYANAQAYAQKAIDAEVAAGQKPNETAAQIVAQAKAAKP